MQQAVDDINARYDAVLAALESHATTRVVKASFYRDIGVHTDAELAQGVVMMMLASEGGYTNNFAMQAKLGETQLRIVYHLHAGSEAEPKATRIAEGEAAEEVKAFVRAGVAGLSLELVDVQFSRQLDHPYGWIVATVRAVAPKSNEY
ncbi:MAG: hypothetical protein ACOC71_06670 [Hyphomicrobiales bacterium]